MPWSHRPDGDSPHLTSAVVRDLRARRVVVVGDALLDRFTDAHAERWCREGPAPRLRVDDVRSCPGGAANVAANLAALGASVELVSVVGDDPAGRELVTALAELGVGAGGVVRDRAWSTPVLNRLRADGELLVRVDEGADGHAGGEPSAPLAGLVSDAAATADAVVVSDYSRGVVGEAVVEAVARIGSQPGSGCPLVAVDARHPARYRRLGPTLVKPNWTEAVPLIGNRGRDRPSGAGGLPGEVGGLGRWQDLAGATVGGLGGRLDQPGPGAPGDLADVPELPDLPDRAGDRAGLVVRHARTILARTGAHIVAVTLDRDGAVVLERGGRPHRTLTRPTTEDHATGAGDTYLAALTLGLASGLPTPSAADLAAVAAGIVVRDRFTGQCRADALTAALDDCGSPPGPAPAAVAGT